MNDKPQAILFDWDNTLVDTWPLIEYAINEMMLGMGREKWTLEQIKQNVHKSARDALPELFGEEWPKAAAIYYDSYKSNSRNKIQLLPFAKEVLDLLREDNSIHVAVISNKHGSTLREEVNHLGLGNHFKKIIGSQDAKEDKPSPLPVYMALEGSGISPSQEVWFIGDSIVDIECALNSGCKPIYFGTDSSAIVMEQSIKSLKSHQELLTSLKHYLLFYR